VLKNLDLLLNADGLQARRASNEIFLNDAAREEHE
jgi:hypothetical protein